jgi:phosphopantetheinyl transferase
MNVVHQSLTSLLAEMNQQSLATWLTPSELGELATWCDASRAKQWQAGRWLAMRELAALIGASHLEIDIASRDSFGRAVAPRVTVRGRAWLGSLSISHASDEVAVALDTRPGSRVGVDVVAIDSHSWNDGALATWFTEDEQLWIRSAENVARRAAHLWAIKEAAYKATQRGEPFVPLDWPSLNWLHGDADETLEITELDNVVIAAICRPPIAFRREPKIREQVHNRHTLTRSPAV